MKISLNWLKDYINIENSPEELSEILTSLGLEVEGMEMFESVKGGLKDLIVGEVVECGKHPNADRLSLTKVKVNSDEILQIVCGAPNVEEGQKVVVAKVGTTIYPSNGDPIKLKKGKIRGEVSEGMICAEDEIGIGNEHSGIIVLPEETEVGRLVSDIYEIENDVIYDIGLTPNRSDATSHLGVARDLAAYYGFHSNTTCQVNYPNLDRFAAGSNEIVAVEVKDTTACPRYSGISISGIKISPSPQWMQNRLKSIDVRPINNIVDITNYVLHEFGQPLHAFDQSEITDSKIIVQKLEQGSKFQSLDEVDRTLSDSDLIICDGENNGMCIAGVFGGIKSGVKSTTDKIFLESAHFEAIGIRKTSTAHNLRTDAAKCFEKGSDPNITIDALKRAALLMEELAEARVDSSLIDVYPDIIEPIKVKVRLKEISRLIGNTVSNDHIKSALNALNMPFRIISEEEYEVSVPTDKADVTREVDIIEEILRIYGFNNVNTDNRISISIGSTIQPNLPKLREVIGNNLIGKGYNEMMGLSIVSSKLYDSFDSFKDNAVQINNTSNVYLDIMRPEMMFSVLNTIQYNYNRQQKDLKLFEFGNSYSRNQDSISEEELVVIAITGSEKDESWIAETRESDFYSIKRVVNEIIGAMGILNFEVSDLDDIRFDYGLKYQIGKNIIASLGKVNALAQKNLGIKTDIFYAEIDLNQLLSMQASNIIGIEDIPKYPYSRRDLALVVNNSVQYSDIEELVNKAGKGLIENVNLFDVYKDEDVVGKEKKSYAFSMQFVSRNKSLSDKEIDKTINKIVRLSEEKLGAQLR